MISTAIMAILSATRGKPTIGTAELHAVLRIVERLLHRRLRHADGARRGLDAGRFEGLHELLEAQPLDAAEQVLRLHLEAVEGDLVFLHAAIAEHLDLGAGHALAPGTDCLSSPRGFSASSMDRPRWPVSFGLVRTSSVIRSARTGWVIQVLLP